MDVDNYQDTKMTNPKAKTAEEIADYRNENVFSDNGTTLVDFDALREQIESYAEERVKEAVVNSFGAEYRQAEANGFRAGQERMRERAAIESENCDESNWEFVTRWIRALGVEEK
jgi:hypothetical protein